MVSSLYQLVALAKKVGRAGSTSPQKWWVRELNCWELGFEPAGQRAAGEEGLKAKANAQFLQPVRGARRLATRKKTKTIPEG